MIKKCLLVIFAMFLPFNCLAENYILKRAVLTWEDGRVDDSSIGPFRARGTMTINGSRVVQSLTFCSTIDENSCEVVAENSGGTIVDVQPNAIRVSMQLDSDGSVGDLTILSLSPTIITLFGYTDGTAEIHEWEPAK